MKKTAVFILLIMMVALQINAITEKEYETGEWFLVNDRCWDKGNESVSTKVYQQPNEMKSLSKLNDAARDSLPERSNEIILYDFLAKQITNANIQAGENLYFKHETNFIGFFWDAVELGVSKIKDNNSITQEAYDAMYEKVNAIIDPVRKCLTIDYINDLYQHTNGYAFKLSYYYTDELVIVSTIEIMLYPDSDEEFVLGKHNNNFAHTSVEGGGFEGVDKYDLTWNKYTALMGYADASEALVISLKLAAMDEWEGSCHGVSSTMFLAWSDKLKLSQFEKDANNYFDMPLPNEDDDFLECLTYFQLSQAITAGQKADKGKIDKLLPKLLRELDDRPVVFSYGYDNCGHSICAFTYEEDLGGNYWVLMYDLNSVYVGNKGKFTFLQITKDYSDYRLITPSGRNLSKDDIKYIKFTTISEINRINPYKTSRIRNIEGEQNYDNVVTITVPMSAKSYTIENSQGEKIICDAEGDFAGSMELLDIDLYIGGENSESIWNLKVEYDDQFRVISDGNIGSIGFFTDKGCLMLENCVSKDILFEIDKSITIVDQEMDEYNFDAYLSYNMTEDDRIRIIHASATACGKTSISISDDSLSVKSGELKQQKITTIDGLNEYLLEDMNNEESIIEVSTKPLYGYGDANMDGGLDSLDAVYIQRLLANWDGYDGKINWYTADINKDGEVNMLDSIILQRHIAKWPGYEALPYVAQ